MVCARCHIIIGRYETSYVLAQAILTYYFLLDGLYCREFMMEAQVTCSSVLNARAHSRGLVCLMPTLADCIRRPLAHFKPPQLYLVGFFSLCLSNVLLSPCVWLSPSQPMHQFQTLVILSTFFIHFDDIDKLPLYTFDTVKSLRWLHLCNMTAPCVFLGIHISSCKCC